jgi:1,4-alpha-glucan branching enzyme
MGASGLWELFIPDLGEGAVYKYEIVGEDGSTQLKTDPFAFRSELRPKNAGIVHALNGYEWRDGAWMKTRTNEDPLRRPWSMYEMHLGGWRRVPGEEGPGSGDGGGHAGRWLTYRELAPLLVEHCKKTGFTHVELMPVTEYPYDGSWGYQVTGYFSPTARHGHPDDLRYLIDALHQAGIGVVLDWVPAHFPRDAHGLRRFDGTAVYEHLDPRQGEHADWGTMVFNYGRAEVKNFLIASALFWLGEYHFDGLRVDAVASMLYLDYSRKHGEWVANVHGGRENLDAIAFLRELNEVVHAEHPGAVVIAEESTAWPAVSRPLYVGGLGFTFKWNMGWMHDTLAYFSLDPIHRKHHHNRITFGLWYAWTENFVLPLSHDEVVHAKGSLIGKMPGDEWKQFANLRALYAWMWAHPGKKLLFMGGEIAQRREFSETRSLDWHLLGEAKHAGMMQLVSDLNAAYRAHPALWTSDFETEGFQWIDANDAQQSVASFVRWPVEPKTGAPPSQSPRTFVVCILNATPLVRRNYRVGVPVGGDYDVLIDTDDAKYGGSGVGNGSRVHAEAIGSHGLPASLVLTLPPLGVIWLRGVERPEKQADS